MSSKESEGLSSNVHEKLVPAPTDEEFDLDEDATEEDDGQAESEEDSKGSKAPRPTKYVVMASTGEDGPWRNVGTYEAYGQTPAKKAAAAELGESASEQWFIAIPGSSYAPQKPSVVVTTVVTFSG